jgi:hypothetical protein
MKYEPGKGWVDDDGGDGDAPVPFAVSGKMPKGIVVGRAPADEAVAPTSAAGPSSPSGRGPSLSPEVAAALAEAEARAAGGAPPLPSDVEDGGEAAPSTRKPAKPMKLDPALLQKALEKKNAAGN